ncbi:MAG TPA: metallopeptidase family protein, partial [Tepidisphaeraceae bacterium]|nr:metallopeptidase family protein [Tepidisphaeraceae bacterium]
QNQQRAHKKNVSHRLSILTVAYRVSKSRFAELVEAAVEELPAEFAQFLEEVPIEIMDRPSKSQSEGMKLGPGNLLLGLYRGRPRTMRNVEDSGVMPDVIYIFQEPIQQVCRSEAELVRQVRITVLHEIGHHFGMNEEDLRKLGYG